MIKKVILVFLLSLFVNAQEINEVDSVILKVNKLDDVSTGHTVISIDNNFGHSLGSDLSTQTGVYFKEYGNGMLSSISYRGLSTSHTGVYFEGIPINSTLNGQTDFNLIYPNGFNSINFRTGGGGATFGSGAVGGSLHLHNNLKFNKGFKGFVKQTIGSFNTYGTQIGTQYSDNNNALKADFYRLYSKNDYKYNYNNQEYTVKNGEVETRVTNLVYNRKINTKNNLKLALNYAIADRDLIEMIGYTSDQKQKDNNYNNVISWLYNSDKYEHKLSQAFLYNKYKYFMNKDMEDFDYGQTESWITKYEGSYKLNSFLKLGLIGQFSYLNGEGTNIDEPSLSDSFLSAYFQYKRTNLKQILTLSKGLSSKFDIPFTIDYGIEHRIGLLKLHGNLTTNYRNPTFNELYWNIGGNPDLKPEQGWSSEIGVEYKTRVFNALDIKLQTNGFYSEFNDWIMWLPNTDKNGLYSPINIRNVKSYGIEFFTNLEYDFNTLNLNLNSNYTYLESIDDKTNSQLTYTPKHKLNNQLQARIANGFLNLRHQFIDEVYTNTDNTNKLQSFNLFDASIGYDLNIFQSNTILELSVNNIFDEEYQLILGGPMPKRNYRIQFNINF